ncbi:MAG: aminotransferase class IV [Kineosporiaceae bacterium]
MPGVSTWVVGVLGSGLADPAAPLLRVDDLGLQRGDGCFETVLVRPHVPAEPAGGDPGGGLRAVHLDAHLARLARSAAALDLPPVDEAAWRDLVAEVLAAGRDLVADEAILKLLLTRGESGAPPGDPGTGLVTLGPVLPAIIRQRGTGLSVVGLTVGTVPGVHAVAPWLLGGVKTLSYAVNMAALREAARRGADDAVLLAADGTVLEAPTATVLWWAGDHLATTPVAGTGVLPGTTQQSLFAAAAGAGLTTGYDTVSVDELAAADAVWLASSVRGVTPVHTLDGRPVATRPDLTALLAPVALGDEPPAARPVPAAVPAAAPRP